jgi:hypothetical protein
MRARSRLPQDVTAYRQHSRTFTAGLSNEAVKLSSGLNYRSFALKDADATGGHAPGRARSLPPGRYVPLDHLVVGNNCHTEDEKVKPQHRMVIREMMRRACSRALSLFQNVVMRAIARIVGGRNATPFVVFPRSLGGPGTGSRVPAGPTARSCEESNLDTSGWNDDTAAVPSARISSLRVRVPPEFVAAEYNVHEAEGAHWDHILGTWYVRRDVNDPVDLPSESFWIGPEAGYPTLGMPPGTRQSCLLLNASM